MVQTKPDTSHLTPPKYERGTVVEVYNWREGEHHEIGSPFVDKHMRVGIIVGVRPEKMKSFGVEREELDHWEYIVLVGTDKIEMHEDDIEVSR